jgi:hypothetical protein
LKLADRVRGRRALRPPERASALTRSCKACEGTNTPPSDHTLSMICVPSVGTTRVICAVCAPLTKNVVAAGSQSKRCSVNVLEPQRVSVNTGNMRVYGAPEVSARKCHIDRVERLRRVMNLVCKVWVGGKKLDV